MKYLIGLDIGTSGVKGLLIDAGGQIAAESTFEYPLSTPRPLWSEQDPGDWEQATVKCLRDLQDKSGASANEIISLGLSGQMHGLVLLDKDEKVLRPCILWNDQRTGEECAEITEKIGFDRLMNITGNPVLPGFTAPKLAWVQKHEPEVFDKIAHVLLPKDFIRQRLSGEFATEVSDASGTSLLDVNRRDWSGEIIEELGFRREWMPRVYESVEVTGTISQKAAELTGLSPKTTIVGGGGDQAAGGIGSGTVKPGIMSLVLGTSGVVFAHTDKLAIEPKGRLHAFCHAVPGTWHLMGVTLSAAGSYKWISGLLQEESFKSLDSIAAQAPAGSEGVLFLPYLSGERTPYPDPNAKGTFTGLSLRHGQPHLVRSVLEGVAYSLKDCVSLMENIGQSVSSVRITGGGARSPLWRQIIADVLDAEIQTVTSTEGAPFGAALLAAVAGGAFADVREACDATIRISDTTAPDKSSTAVYAEYYDIYRSLYPALKNSFDRITKTVSNS